MTDPVHHASWCALPSFQCVWGLVGWWRKPTTFSARCRHWSRGRTTRLKSLSRGGWVGQHEPAWTEPSESSLEYKYERTLLFMIMHKMKIYLLGHAIWNDEDNEWYIVVIIHNKCIKWKFDFWVTRIEMTQVIKDLLPAVVIIHNKCQVNLPFGLRELKWQR